MNEKRFFSKARIIYLCISVTALIITSILLIIIRFQSTSLLSQLAASRWSSDGTSFAQITTFISPDAHVNDDSIVQLTATIDNKLKEASLVPDDENVRAWIYTYSTQDTINISSSRASVSTNVTGVGGDYFMFHPLKLLSGFYFTGTDLSYDRIVIDEDLAWQLFGSFNVDGMEVTINEKPYIIAAVIQKDNNKASLEVYGDLPRAYMSYTALNDITGSVNNITCFESVSPDPISAFSYNIINDSVSFGDGMFEIVENSSRFKISSLLSKLTNFTKLSVRENTIKLPFWENAARIIETRLSIILFFALIFAIIPISFVLSSVITLWRRRKWRFSDIKTKISDYFEEQSIKRYEKREKIKKESNNETT